MSWLGTGATASLVSNDIVVYGGGESLWTLSLANQTWNEAWTTGQTPPHGLRFHTATSLRLAPNFGEPGAAVQLQQQQPNRSQSNDSTVSSPSTIGAMIVLGGEPRASADLSEATQHGDKLNMHVLKVRQRAWTVAACTGDVPDNRCMHTTTKLRGTTLAVYGGRPLGKAHPTSEEASPVFEDTNELRAKLAADGFYDVYIIDANVGVWRKITPSTDPSNGGPIYTPCLWGHAAFATSVFPPRRSQTGDYRHRIDLVIQGGFDISPSPAHQSQVAAFTGSHNQRQQHAFVLQPVSETQPTLLKWGIAPLAADDNRSNSGDGAYTLHAATSADTVREGAHPAFFIGGFNMKTEDDGEIGLQPIAACGRISLRGSWADGPRGQIASLPPLQTLFQSTARPLLLFYSDQLIVLENTNRFWLLDLQLSEDEMEWASMDTTLGPNEDVERWRIGCPLHPDFSALNNNDNEGDGNENQQIEDERHQKQQEEKRKQQEQEKNQVDEKRRADRRKKRQERDERKLQRQREIDERRNDPNQKPPKPKAGEVRGEWKCIEDPKTGRNYYVNATTRKSTWKIEETSFIEPLPTDTQYPSNDKFSDDDEDLDSTVDGETDKEYQQRMMSSNNKNNNNNNNSPTWRDTTQGESINGYETSMMNPEYDRDDGNNFHNNNYHQSNSQAGTPQQLSRFLSGGAGVGNNDQQNNNNNNSTGNNNWWNTAADAKSRNARDQSRSQAGLNHSLDRPQDQNEETEDNNNKQNIQKSHQQKHSEKPPLAASAPSRTPTSQIGPPSHLPTPSIWNEPHVDLPIDNLLKMIDGDLERDRQVKRRNSLLNSMLTEDSVARKKRQEDERKAKAWELLEQEKLTENTNNNNNNQKSKRGGYYAAEEEEKKIPDVDPAEVLQYPFDLETALLLPHSTILRARKIYIDKQKSETQVPKSRDIDIKKFLQQYTHYESASDDGRKLERQQRHHFLNNNNSSDNSFNQFNQQRTVFDMLPSMLVGGKFQEYVDEVSTSRFSAVGLVGDKENNNNNNHNRDDVNKSSTSPGIQHNSNNRFGRPTALVAADFSRTGSAIHHYGEASSSRTSSTPHIAAQIFTDLIPEQHLDGVRKAMMMQNSRSVSQQNPDKIKGLGTHHVSQSIRDMVNNNDENEYF